MFRRAFVVGSVLALAAANACGSGVSAFDSAPSSDSGTKTGPTVDDARASADAETPAATMRLAHVARGLGPIDFCYQGPKMGIFAGPVLEAPGDAAAEAANTGYATVSKYVALEAAGPIRLAIVEAGATSCGNPLATASVTLDPGKLSTVAVFADTTTDGGRELEARAFTDDRKTSPNELRARTIHAAHGKGPFAVRAVASKTTIFADRIEPRRTAPPSDAVHIDELGYVTAPPIPPPASLAVGPAPGIAGADAGLFFEPWQSQATDLELQGGSLHTAFILSDDLGFEVLWCADTTTAGGRTACKIVK